MDVYVLIDDREVMGVARTLPIAMMVADQFELGDESWGPWNEVARSSNYTTGTWERIYFTPTRPSRRQTIELHQTWRSA